jgi:hypothetical protein
MTTPIIDRIMQSIAAHTGAGLFAELDDIEPCATDDIYISCPQCGRRVSIYNHLCDMGSGGTSPVGCAFGGGNSDAQQLEFDEIPLEDAVQKCHEIAEKMRMYE